MTITNGYCSLADVKAALRLEDGIDDSLIENAIEGASRRIDGYCGRFFYQTPQTPVLIYPFDLFTLIFPNDVSNSSITIEVDEIGDGTYSTVLVQNTDYLLEPTNAALTGRPYEKAVMVGAVTLPEKVQPSLPAVRVTAQWGWAAVPHDVREACILLSMRQFARLNAALGVVGFADMAIQVKAVDPDVRDLLNPYRKFGIA